MSPATIHFRPLIQRALAALQTGNPLQALALVDSHADESSEYRAEWLLIRALSLSALSRPGEALPGFRELIHLQPNVPEHWNNLGNCLCELGSEAEALSPLQRALQLGADDAGVHFGLARAYCRTGELPAAERHIQRALQFENGNSDMVLLQTRIALAADRVERARPLLAALRKAQLSPGQRSDLGFLEMQAGQYVAAVQSFQTTLNALPDDIEARIGLGLALERSNRVDAARLQRERITAEIAAALSTALASKLLQLDARLASRAGDEAKAQAALQQLLAEELPDQALRANLAFALGRSFDKTRDTAAAMQAFRAAHATRRALVAANHPELVGRDDLLSMLKRDVPRHLPALQPDDAEHDPIFLVGFPRSGTTLLEQLLDAHPALSSFDEQAFLQHLLDDLRHQGQAYPEALATLDAEQMGQLRQRYFSEVNSVVPDRRHIRIVDKNPLNLARLPLANALFPKAQVLLALRHPCDVVLSCYMQSFRAPAFAFTFETLASTARMYAEVMHFWARIEPQLTVPVHVLRYEDLVVDVENQARKLFEFLGLSWHDELLAFTERAAKKGAISTPSYSDVTQPVNRRAVGRWQRYRNYFTSDVLDSLAPFIERFGYRLD